MSKVFFSRAVLSVLIASAALTSSWGQDGAPLPEIGLEMTERDSNGQQMAITPDSRHLFKPEVFESRYLVPLRWELEKHRIYRNLVEKDIASVTEQLNGLVAQREQASVELSKAGATTLDQLDRNMLSLQEAGLKTAVLKAEADALREAMSERKKSTNGGTREKIGEAVSLQKELVSLAEDRLRSIQSLRSSGRMTDTEFLEAKAEVLRARRELALMEAEAAQPADAILDAILIRLTEIEPQRAAAGAEVERLRDLAEKAAHVRQLITDREQLERDIDSLQQRKDQLLVRLREQDLHAAYIEEILKRYESYESSGSEGEEKADLGDAG